MCSISLQCVDIIYITMRESDTKLCMLNVSDAIEARMLQLVTVVGWLCMLNVSDAIEARMLQLVTVVGWLCMLNVSDAIEARMLQLVTVLSWLCMLIVLMPLRLGCFCQ